MKTKRAGGVAQMEEYLQGPGFNPQYWKKKSIKVD
jgi:hypothetical protein